MERGAAAAAPRHGTRARAPTSWRCGLGGAVEGGAEGPYPPHPCRGLVLGGQDHTPTPLPTPPLPSTSPTPLPPSPPSRPPPSPSPICAFHSVRSLPLGAHPALRPRPPPLSWLAWVASPHHHAPGGREVDGALSRPSPKRNGAPNTCPDYCAFPGCSLSAREGSVRVVIPWNTRTLPRHLRRPVRLRPYHQDREAARAHRLGRETPDWHPCLSGQGGPPQRPLELRLAAFLPL